MVNAAFLLLSAFFGLSLALHQATLARLFKRER